MAFTKELRFSELTQMLDKVSSSTDGKKRDKYMNEYFVKLLSFQADYRKKNIGNVSKFLSALTGSHPHKFYQFLRRIFQDSSILPVLRLILAQEEKDRAYGLQEKSLRQLYIRSLQLDSNDAIKITQCSEDNLHNVIYEVMKTRCSSEGTLSVHEVKWAIINHPISLSLIHPISSSGGQNIDTA